MYEKLKEKCQTGLTFLRPPSGKYPAAVAGGTVAVRGPRLTHLGMTHTPWGRAEKRAPSTTTLAHAHYHSQLELRALNCAVDAPRGCC